jgi:hypothetical protein
MALLSKKRRRYSVAEFATSSRLMNHYGDEVMPVVELGDHRANWTEGDNGMAPTTKILLELVRETKGGAELERLRFPTEKRKILCARKHFESIGINYRVVTDQTADWWEPGDDQLDVPV